LLVVGGVLKLPVPLVAGTLPRVLTPVQAVAERLTFGLLKILPNVVVHDFVRLDVLYTYELAKRSLRVYLHSRSAP
jgi:hypothetical protein